MKKKSRFILVVALLLAILTISVVSAALFLLFPLNPNPNGNSPTPTPNPNRTTVSPSPTSTFKPVILGKHFPSNYVMGFEVDGGLINGMNVVFIESVGQRVSIRFTAKTVGTVTEIVIHAFAYKGEPTIRIGLQEDNNGNPKGGWIKENAFGVVQLESASGFKTIHLGTPVSLTKGQVYHIVIEAAKDPLNGIAALTTYPGNGFAQPLNPVDPDIIWTDPQMNVLSFSGGIWNQKNKWPVFILSYSDGTSEGQPYSLVAQWVVWGKTYVGQNLMPASDYKVGKIAFVVSLGNGNPQDKLFYRIMDSNNNVLAEGVFVDRGKLTSSQTWIEATLTKPVMLEAGKLYRIVLLSPQTDLASAYYLFGHEFCYNPYIGYGSVQHQLTSTISGGDHWGDNSDADAVFKLTTVS